MTKGKDQVLIIRHPKKNTQCCILSPTFLFLCSDQSQSDSSTRDFWMNMQAITVYLKKLSEQNPSASYYNVDVLKYQVNTFFPLEFFNELWLMSNLHRIYKSCSLPDSIQMNCHPASISILDMSLFPIHRVCPGWVHCCYAFMSFPWIPLNSWHVSARSHLTPSVKTLNTVSLGTC